MEPHPHSIRQRVAKRGLCTRTTLNHSPFTIRSRAERNRVNARRATDWDVSRQVAVGVRAEFIANCFCVYPPKHILRHTCQRFMLECFIDKTSTISLYSCCCCCCCCAMQREHIHNTQSPIQNDKYLLNCSFCLAFESFWSFALLRLTVLHSSDSHL